MELTLHDLEAVLDVLSTVGEQSDTFDAETAIRFYEKLQEVVRKANETKSLCEIQARRALDGQPIRVGNTVYVERMVGKWRPEHDRIKERVTSVAVCDTRTGEIRPPREAAQTAVNLMYDLFVAPASMPKKTGLDRIGVAAADVAHWEHTGYELAATKLEDGGK